MTTRSPHRRLHRQQAEFARPILEHVRAVVHEACPDVERDPQVVDADLPVRRRASSAAWRPFKQHASFGYWKHALVVGEGEPRDGMGSYGKLTSLKELPPKKTLIAHIRKADAVEPRKDAACAQEGRAEATAGVPADLAAALKKNAKARKGIESFPPGAQREYVEWIIEAKREETRASRLAQAVEWMAEGKRRNWKYENC
jgi:hypothetical protein